MLHIFTPNLYNLKTSNFRALVFLQEPVSPLSLPGFTGRTRHFGWTYKNECLDGLVDLQECISGRTLIGKLSWIYVQQSNQ